MLDLDEMRKQWTQYDRKLDESIHLSRRLMSVTALNGARPALQRLAASLSLEAVVWFAIVMAIGSFIYEHFGMLRFVLPAAALDLYAIGMLATTTRQIVAAQQIDYSRPIAAIQKHLETLRVLRIRITQWALLAGAVVWAPLVIVVAKAIFGIEVYNVAWLGANVLFGLSMIPLAVWLSKKFGDRASRSSFLERVMKDIAGHNLNAARAFLERLSEFEDKNVAV